MEANGMSSSNGNNGSNPNGSMKYVYTVVDTRSGKPAWVKIGAAFTNRDGSLTVRLDALPVNGSMQVREPAPWEDRKHDPATASSGQALATRHASEAFA